MNDKIISLLQEYKNISLDIIKIINNDNYNSLLPYVNKREEIIQELYSVNYNPNDYKPYIEELNILEIENEINNIFKKDINKIEKELKTLKNAKLANKAYNNNFYQNVIGLDVKIY